MALTYGEEVLARAEAKARARGVRRRLLLLIPSVVTALWALGDLLAARRGHLAAVEAGAIRRLVDPVLPVVWTVAFVVMPLIASMGTQPMPVGALCALLAGPIVTPMLFGAGGWHPWQIAVLVLATVLVLGAARERRRRFPA